MNIYRILFSLPYLIISFSQHSFSSDINKYDPEIVSEELSSNIDNFLKKIKITDNRNKTLYKLHKKITSREKKYDAFFGDMGEELLYDCEAEKYYSSLYEMVYNDLKNLSLQENLIDNFIVIKNVEDIKDARVFFFPECHIDPRGRLLSYAMMYQLAGKDDQVLFEGGNSSIRGDATEETIAFVMANRIFNENYSIKEYTPELFASIFQNARKYVSTIQKEIKKKEKKEMSASGWDTSPLDPFLIRNQEMVRTIAWKLDRFNRLFINAGSFHIPHVSYAIFQRAWNCIPVLNIWKQISSLLKTGTLIYAEPNPQISASYYENNPLDSTKVIYEYLKKNDIPFAVYISKSMFEVNIPHPLFSWLTDIENYIPRNPL